MTSNLFVNFPDSGGPATMWEFAWRQIPVALHIIVGTLLFVFSIVILVIAIKQKAKKWIASGTVGLVSIFIAGYSGAQFVSTQSAIFSYIMSIFFIIAFVSYAFVMGS